MLKKALIIPEQSIFPLKLIFLEIPLQRSKTLIPKFIAGLFYFSDRMLFKII